MDRGDYNYWERSAAATSAERAKTLLQQYFEDCFNHQPKPRKPTKAGLCLALGVDEERFDKMANGEEPYSKAHKKAIEQARLAVRDALEQRTDTVSIFLLKQPFYGGYSDKQAETGGGLTIQVQVTGVDGKTAQELGK